jgi:hypothetical protein
MSHSKSLSHQSHRWRNLGQSPIHLYTKAFICLTIDLLSRGLAEKFTYTNFADTLAGLKILKRTFVTNSYVCIWSFVQWIVCSPKVSRYALRKTGQTLSIKNNRIMSKCMRVVQYVIDNICCMCYFQVSINKNS